MVKFGKFALEITIGVLLYEIFGIGILVEEEVVVEELLITVIEWTT